MVEVASCGCDVSVEVDTGMLQECQERISEFPSSLEAKKADLAKVETSLIAVLAAREDSCAHVTADQKVYNGILTKMDNISSHWQALGSRRCFTTQ